MVIDNYFLLFQKWMEELPQWSSGEEFTCQCRGQGFNPWPRKMSHALEQLLDFCITSTEPQRHSWGVYAPQQQIPNGALKT